MLPICMNGENCFHEALLYSVGETRKRTVEFAIHESYGMLTLLVVSNFTSWRKHKGKYPNRANKNAKHHKSIASIDCISRGEHGLIIYCMDIEFGFFLELQFFGTGVQLSTHNIRQVETPRSFAYEKVKKYYQSYFHYFQDPSVREGIGSHV